MQMLFEYWFVLVVRCSPTHSSTLDLREHMPSIHEADSFAPPPPVAIGGIGGSGTRLIAGLLRDAGIFMGDGLNASNDLLWFTLLFKHEYACDMDDDEFGQRVDILTAGLTGGAPLDARSRARVAELADAASARDPNLEAAAAADSLIAAAARPAHRHPWGWKEPNTHIVIERLWRHLPELRYVHVVRHGVDMAFSANQNQLALWGPRMLGSDGDLSPPRSLRYWCHVHRRLQSLFAANRQRMYWLDYDEFCREPEKEFEQLRQFLASPALPVPDLSVVRKPGEPRHAGQDLSGFAPADLAYVSSLGYQIASQTREVECERVNACPE